MELLQQVAPYLSSVMVGIIGFFAGRKKANLQNNTLETENASKNLKLYQDMLDDLDSRYDQRFKEQETHNEKKFKAQEAYYTKKLAEQKKYFTNKIEGLTKELTHFRNDKQD